MLPDAFDTQIAGKGNPITRVFWDTGHLPFGVVTSECKRTVNRCKLPLSPFCYFLSKSTINWVFVLDVEISKFGDEKCSWVNCMRILNISARHSSYKAAFSGITTNYRCVTYFVCSNTKFSHCFDVLCPFALIFI